MIRKKSCVEITRSSKNSLDEHVVPRTGWSVVFGGFLRKINAATLFPRETESEGAGLEEPDTRIPLESYRMRVFREFRNGDEHSENSLGTE